MLSVVMLSVIILSVFMLSVVMPLARDQIIGSKVNNASKSETNKRF